MISVAKIVKLYNNVKDLNWKVKLVIHVGL